MGNVSCIFIIVNNSVPPYGVQTTVHWLLRVTVGDRSCLVSVNRRIERKYFDWENSSAYENSLNMNGIIHHRKMDLFIWNLRNLEKYSRIECRIQLKHVTHNIIIRLATVPCTTCCYMGHPIELSKRLKKHLTEKAYQTSFSVTLSFMLPMSDAWCHSLFAVHE